jgi:hypothetical protein
MTAFPAIFLVAFSLKNMSFSEKATKKIAGEAVIFRVQYSDHFVRTERP